MTHKELAQVVKEAKKGKTEAFALLYNHFAQSIYYTALRITRNEFDAQDVVQETIVALYKGVNTLRDPQAVTKFVNMTAYNFCLMTLRSRKKTPVDSEGDLENIDVSLDEEFLPEKYLESKELQQQLINIIDTLGDVQRTAVILYYYEDLSVREMSEVLEVSEQAVKNRVFRAREAIKEMLRKESRKGSLKGGIIGVATTIILSKVLEMDASAHFSAERHAQLWQKAATQAGIPVAEVAAATAVAAAAPKSGTATAGGTVASGIAGMQIVAAVVATVTIVSGSILAYRTITKSGDKLTTEPVIAESGELETASKSTVSVETKDNGETEIITSESTTTVSEKSEESEESQVESRESKDTSESKETSEAIAQKESVGDTTSLRLELPNKEPLSYKMGTKLDLDRIIADANLVVQQNTKIQVLHLDEVDTNTIGEYGVYLWAVNDQGTISNRVGVIIIITE